MASVPPDGNSGDEGGGWFDNWTWSDSGHLGLDIVGLIPGYGEPADLTNAAWYAAEGNYLDAGLSAISVVPIYGDIVGKGGKLAKAGVIKVSGPALEALKKVDFAMALGPLRSNEKLAPHIDKMVEALEKWRKDTIGVEPPCTPGGKQICPLTGRQQVEISGGKKGEWPKELNAQKLMPNTDYLVNGYKYSTDELGRVTRVKGELSRKQADRNSYQQAVAGRADRADTDQGGHLVASIFNGPGDRINLVAMDGNLNQGAWKKMENEFADALKDGKSVEVDIAAIYGTSSRPDDFVVNAVIDGKPKSYMFTNAPGG